MQSWATLKELFNNSFQWLHMQKYVSIRVRTFSITVYQNKLEIIERNKEHTKCSRTPSLK